jgi:hypothetical protein
MTEPEPQAARPTGGPARLDRRVIGVWRLHYLVRAGVAGALATGDVDGNGTDDLLIAGRLYRVQRGYVVDATQSAGLGLRGRFPPISLRTV